MTPLGVTQKKPLTQGYTTAYMCLLGLIQYYIGLVVKTNLYFVLYSQDKPTFQNETGNSLMFLQVDVHSQIFLNDTLHPCSLQQTTGMTQPTIYKRQSNTQA
jgi:hypothetical protein